MRATAFVFCSLAVPLSACGTDDADTNPPPNPPPTTEPVGLGSCDGDCAVLAAGASNEVLGVAFDRAFYGITSSASGDSLYVELSRGGDNGCPSKQSATPDQLLIVSGIPIFTTRDALSHADGITSNIFDFTGELTKVLAPSAHIIVTIMPSAISLTSPKFIAFDFDNTYENSLTGAGHVYATHCASLDTTE